MNIALFETKTIFLSVILNPLPDNGVVQIETDCRRHFKVHLKWKISTI